MIRDRIRAGDVETGPHVIEHGAVEGFLPRHAWAAVLDGIIIEHYPERGRCLLAGRVRALGRRLLWLHVVCDYNDPVKVGLTTAYVPDAAAWGDPPIRRR
jgi:hypothetical protein